MARGSSAIALAAAMAAAGCVFTPDGRCESSAECAAGEVCSAGVCVHPSASGTGGVDPASFTPVLWSTMERQTGATFGVDSIGADPSGNVVVAGTVDAEFDFAPDLVGTGAFVVKRAAADGASMWAASFPTFVHSRFKTAVLADGKVFFAGTAFERTVIGGVLDTIPPARGALIVGQLASDGTPLWARSIVNTHPSADLVPTAATVSAGGDLLVAGTGSGNFGPGAGSGCIANTANESFAAALSGANGDCVWSRGFGTRTLSDVEAHDDGKVAIVGVCTPPVGASFDPGGGTSCTTGLFVAVLDGSAGTTLWARTSSGAGTVSAVRDLAVAPDGRATVIGDATGVIDFGRGPVDFGSAQASFAATWDPSGLATSLVRPLESPYGAERDELAFSRCAYDRTGRLWMAGRYAGQPTLGGIRFSACRAPECGAAAFLTALDARGDVTSFLPIRAAPEADGGAYVDDLVLFATTGTVASAMRFTGASMPGGPQWSTAAGGLGMLRVVPSP
jgi:hypothetical protein